MEMTHEKTREKHSINTYQLTATALMAAVLCALASMSITIGIVPISLATFVIYLDAYILGSRMATVSTFIYLLLGLVGLPVYSGFSSGPAKLFGPTGGYLFGYLFLAFISGWFIERFPKNKIHCRALYLRYLLAGFSGTYGCPHRSHGRCYPVSAGRRHQDRRECHRWPGTAQAYQPHGKLISSAPGNGTVSCLYRT